MNQDTLIARIRELEAEVRETVEAANGWEFQALKYRAALERMDVGLQCCKRDGLNSLGQGLIDWAIRLADETLGSQRQGLEPRCPACGRRQICGNDHFGNCPKAI